MNLVVSQASKGFLLLPLELEIKKSFFFLPQRRHLRRLWICGKLLLRGDRPRFLSFAGQHYALFFFPFLPFAMLYFTCLSFPRLSFSFLSFSILPSPFLPTRLSKTWLLSRPRSSKVGLRRSAPVFPPFIDLIPLLSCSLRHKLIYRYVIAIKRSYCSHTQRAGWPPTPDETGSKSLLAQNLGHPNSPQRSTLNLPGAVRATHHRPLPSR